MLAVHNHVHLFQTLTINCFSINDVQDLSWAGNQYSGFIHRSLQRRFCQIITSAGQMVVLLLHVFMLHVYDLGRSGDDLSRFNKKVHK